MTGFHLHVPSRLERLVKRRAKKAFPKETFGLLLGTVVGDRLDIDEVWIPEDVDDHCTPGNVNPQPDWLLDGKAYAKESELDVIGWWHSHPHPWEAWKGFIIDRSQSESDLDSQFQLLVSGICVVKECKGGGLRASLRWWGPTIPLRVERI